MKTMMCLSACAALMLLGACSSRNQQRAREDAHKASAELKQDARELRHNIDHAVQPDARSASEKLGEGGQKLETAGSEASVKLHQAALVAQVKTDMASQAGLSTVTGIDVAAAGGVVTLKGRVATQAQKDAADHAAAKVDGVTRVRNEITVER